MNDPTTLEAEGVSFAWSGGAEVLHGVSLRTQASKLVCMLGPNGSGKSTFLRLAMGRLLPSLGRVMLCGRDVRRWSVRQRARVMAYVPQTAQSAFGFRVEEIVLMGRTAHLGPLGIAGENDRKIAGLAMAMTQTDHLAHRAFDQLSGGEAQRVMIARALAQQPKVLLLDEPTSHLDLGHQVHIHQMMRRLAHDWGIALLCISHDLNLAARFADHLVFLREGRVVAEGAPESMLTQDLVSKTFGDYARVVTPPGETLPVVLPHDA